MKSKSTKKLDSIHFLVARRPDGYINYIQVTVYNTTKCYVYRQSRCFTDGCFSQEQLQTLSASIEQYAVPYTTINSIMENCRKYMSSIDYLPDPHHSLYTVIKYVEKKARVFKYRKS